MRTLTRFAALTSLLIAAACGGDGPSEPTSIAGTYVLELVNNQPLPAVLDSGPGWSVEIISGNFVLTSAGTFTTTGAARYTFEGDVETFSESSSGTYTRNGSTVTFTHSDGESVGATIAGNTLTFAEDGFSAVFRK